MTPDTPTTQPESPPLHVKLAGSPDKVTFLTSFKVGRAADNDIVLESDVVSEHHATVVPVADGWHVRDADSRNGLVVDGRVVHDVLIEGTTWIRFGPDGPSLVFSVERAQRIRDTLDNPITEEHLSARYFGNEAPADMGRHTAMMRTVVSREHRRHTHRYRKALVALSLVILAVGAVVFAQRRQLARHRAAAADLYYAIKGMELQIGALGLDSVRLAVYSEQQTDLRRRYRDYVEDLGIYSDNTPERDRLIYRVIGRFGESEVNVPPEFMDDVREAIRAWGTTRRLANAFRRANQNGYGRRIADVMLEHGLPPEFLYLALQESSLRTNAVGPETRFGYAKGMWQIMPGTARDLGLQTGPLVGQPRPDPQDERHDFEKATVAAAKYLRDLYRTDAQASGLLVIASYNWGHNNVLRLIRSMPPNPADRNFWKLLREHRSALPRETYRYILNIVSAAVIGENPELFGLKEPAPLPVVEFQVAPDFVAPE